MKLPRQNPQIAQEKLSILKFHTLFDVTKYQIRDDSPDVGIDVFVELIEDGCNTNWRFAVQIKSCANVIKRGASRAVFDAEIKNLNYLRNYPGNAYYFLYDVESDSFFYTNIHEALDLLDKLKSEWQEQDTVRIELEKLNTPRSLEIIRQQTIDRNKTISQMRTEMAFNYGADPESSWKVIIDSDGTIKNEQRLLELIRNISASLVNKGHWREISDWKMRLTGDCKLTARDYLIFGMAYFFLGELYKALHYFKSASKNTDQLIQREVEVMLYYELSAKKSLSMISDVVYKKSIKEFAIFKSTKLFIEATEILRSVPESIDGTLNYEWIIRKLERIALDPNIDNNTLKICKSQTLLYVGSKNNYRYMEVCYKLHDAIEKRAFSPIIHALKNQIHEFYQKYLKWNYELVLFSKDLESNEDWTHYFTLTINESKVKYEFETFSQIVDGKFGVREITRLTESAFKELIARIKTCENHFISTGNVNNYATALLERYGISHLMKFEDEMIESRESLIEFKKDLVDNVLSQEIEFQLNGGLPHLQRFKNFNHNPNMKKG